MENECPDIDVPLALRLSQFPCIWDRRCQAFKDVRKKKEAFEVLAAEFKCTPQFVAARYKALREKYRKEKIKMKCHKLSKMRRDEWDPLDEVPNYEPWPLLNNLSFLDKVMVPRKRICSTVNLSSPSLHQELGILANYQQSLQGHGSDSAIMFNELEPMKTESEDFELQSGDLELEEGDDFSEGQIPTESSIAKENDHRTTEDQQLKWKSKIENQETGDGKQALVTFQQHGQEEEFEHLGKYLAKTISSLRAGIRDDCILDINKIIYKYKKM